MSAVAGSATRTYVGRATSRRPLAAIRRRQAGGGGTDLVVGARHGSAAARVSIGIHRIPELTSIDVLPGGGLRIRRPREPRDSGRLPSSRRTPGGRRLGDRRSHATRAPTAPSAATS